MHSTTLDIDSSLFSYKSKSMFILCLLLMVARPHGVLQINHGRYSPRRYQLTQRNFRLVKIIRLWHSHWIPQIYNEEWVLSSLCPLCSWFPFTLTFRYSLEISLVFAGNRENSEASFVVDPPVYFAMLSWN